MKQAKLKAAEEGVSLKEIFIKALGKELAKPEETSSGATAPWEKLRGKGSAGSLSPTDSGFEDYSGPDWNHSIQVNEPED